MSKVLIPLADGFEEIEAVSIIDVLRRGGIEVIVAYVGDDSCVTGANKISVVADIDIESISADMIDMIVLPGGSLGAKILSKDAYVQSLLKEMKSKNKLLGAICAAPIALHSAGVLNHNFTCYPTCEDVIRKEGYDSKSLVVEDGNVLTSQGPGSSICFGLAIVERLKDKKSADSLRKGLLAEFCS